MAHFPPIDVSEIVHFLYRNCVDLSPAMEEKFGLELRERIADLRGSDFGRTNERELVRLSTLFDDYANANDCMLQEATKTMINSILLKLLRLSKRL